MNTATDRTAIATAVSTVDGVTCKPRYWQISKSGDGFVQLGSLDRDTSGFGFMVTWQVLVAMPQDLDAAEKWIDDNTPAVLDALAQQLVVTRVQPIDLVLDSGRAPALQITGTRPD